MQLPISELESQGVEKLPPTTLSAEAREKLKKWGVPEQKTRELQVFCSAFRYDRCLEKTQRLSHNKVVIEEVKGDVEIAHFPVFYDTSGRLDGQCSDSGRMFLIMSEFAKLLDDLNANTLLPPGCRIVASLYGGLSKTHFCLPGQNHVWNGLTVVDARGNVVDSLLIDVAFQTIMTAEESGYHPNYIVHEPNILPIQLSEHVQVGEIQIDEHGWEATMDHDLIIGISNDRKYCFGIGFMRRVNSSKKLHGLVPFLTRTHANGKDDYFFLNPDNGELIQYPQSAFLPQSERQEVESILGACQTFEYTNDRSAYASHLESEHTVKWD